MVRNKGPSLLEPPIDVLSFALGETSGFPHRHSGENLLHLWPPESEVRSVHLDACVPLRSEGIEHDPSSRSEYIPLDGVDGVAVPTQLPVDGIGFAEYRRQALGHVAQVR